ncbi:MAG: SOS response-associated peptidase [Verrucomicrobiaceae bacterium]
MCNAFNTAKKLSQVKGELPVGEGRLVRRTDLAPVVLDGDEVVEMRWGFERKGLGVVNNTRSDNLESGMWREAFAERRCLIPVMSYYEWSGPKGRKRTHLFQAADEGWLWAAGIWEEVAELGRCFSMLTTEANERVSPIHHRMPALLVGGEREAYLAGEVERFAPEEDLLVVGETANPLKKRPSEEQGELF